MQQLTIPCWAKISVFCLLALNLIGEQSSTFAEDEETEQRIVAAGECVEIVRFAGSLSQTFVLQADVKERFPDFESDFLTDISSEFPGANEVTSDLSMGQSIGLVFPEFDNYIGVAMPVAANPFLESEDYELGTDNNGNDTIDGQVIAKTDKYLGFTVGDDDFQLQNSIQLSRDLIDFVSRSEARLIRIETSPTAIGRSPLKSTFAGYRAVLQTAAQRHDDETELDYSWRSLATSHNAKLMELFFRDVEKLSFSVLTDDPQNPFVLKIEAECRKKSELLQYFQDMRSQRNTALSWLHPDSSAFATLSMALPKKIQEQLVTAGRLTGDYLKDVEGLSPNTAGQFQQALQNISEAGAVDLLLQKIPFSEESECYAFVMPLASATQVSPELIQLVTNTESLEPAFEIDGWPVYSAETFSDELGLGFNEGWQSVFTVTDSMVAVQIFKDTESEKARAFLEELARRDFLPSPRAAQFSKTIAAAEYSLTDVANFMDGQADSVQQLLPSDVTKVGASRITALDQDRVFFTMALDGNRVVTQWRFEPNAIAMGIQSFAAILDLTTELFDL